MDSKKLIEATEATVFSRAGSPLDLQGVRAELMQDAAPVGSMPPPATLKGAAKTVVSALKGERATVLIDKMAERLAFERSGARLYQSLLVKFEVHGTWDGGPSREHLESILADELAHFQLLYESLPTVGGDPTAMTPSADLTAVASMGIVQVINDARTNLRESMEAILIAELADNACWETLELLAREMGQGALADKFAVALEEERVHLARVREWLAAGIGLSAGVEVQPSAPV